MNIVEPGKSKKKRKTYPLVVKFNPRLPDISKIIKKNMYLLNSSPTLEGLFTPNSIIPAFRRGKNLKEIVAPSKPKRGHFVDSSNLSGCFKCKKKCDLWQNFVVETDSFKSFTTGKRYQIRETLNCTNTNIIYLISCEIANYNMLVLLPRNLRFALEIINPR